MQDEEVCCVNLSRVVIIGRLGGGTKRFVVLRCGGVGRWEDHKIYTRLMTLVFIVMLRSDFVGAAGMCSIQTPG